MLTNKINIEPLHPVIKHHTFYCNQMDCNYKLDKNISKTLIQGNILPTDPNENTKLIIYYDKSKTSSWAIKKNSALSIEVMQKKQRYISI